MALIFHVEDKIIRKKSRVSFEELETFEEIIRKIIVDVDLEGKELMETNLSKNYLVVGIKRKEEYIIPTANTVLNLDDELLLMRKNED